MLERMQRGIWPLIMAVETPDNLTIVEKIMAKAAWEERLAAYLKLWGRADTGDKALGSQLEMLDSKRG